MKINDRVAYSVQWLKSVGLPHSDYSHMRGSVIGCETLGNFKLIEISWDHGAISKVLERNLAIVGPNSKFCNVD